MKSSDLFIKVLEEEGVEYIFGVPGEENLDFLKLLEVLSLGVMVTSAGSENMKAIGLRVILR